MVISDRVAADSRKVIERLNVSRELVMNINIPAGLPLICGGLWWWPFYHAAYYSVGVSPDSRFAGPGPAIILIGLFTMIARKKAVTQNGRFLVMENGVFLEPRRPTACR